MQKLLINENINKLSLKWRAYVVSDIQFLLRKV